MKFIRLLKGATKLIVEWFVSAARGAAHGLKKLFIIGLVVGGLTFAAWWMLPDDWKIKYAAEYMLDTDQILIQRKPYNCDWDSAPIGRKHCHYEKTVTVLNKEGKIIEGPGQVNPLPADQNPTKVYVEWQRMDD